ncbi:ribose-phosphate pyrophosphokinase [bacterium]|nr:ribose-phosphate pyrophosphokinase [bacterium]
MERVVIISGTSHFGLANSVAERLGKECLLPKIFYYGTGDFEVVLPENVRRKLVFVIQSLLPSRRSACYHFLEALMIINAAHKASAEEVNVVVPHLGWDQSDKKWTGRMPIAGELIAAMFHWAGAKRYVGVHFHSPQFPGFFPMECVVDHLVADKLLIDYVTEQGLNRDAVLVAGDLGFSNMAHKIADRIGVPVVDVKKERLSGSEVVIRRIYGSVKNKRVILWDDKIVKGTTMRAIVEELVKQGAREFIIVATHGLFTYSTIRNLSHPLIKEIIVTDTVPHSKYVKKALPLTEITIADLLASAIREISIEGGSVSKLFKGSTVSKE